MKNTEQLRWRLKQADAAYEHDKFKFEELELKLLDMEKRLGLTLAGVTFMVAAELSLILRTTSDAELTALVKKFYLHAYNLMNVKENVNGIAFGKTITVFETAAYITEKTLGIDTSSSHIKDHHIAENYTSIVTAFGADFLTGEPIDGEVGHIRVTIPSLARMTQTPPKKEPDSDSSTSSHPEEEHVETKKTPQIVLNFLPNQKLALKVGDRSTEVARPHATLLTYLLNRRNQLVTCEELQRENIIDSSAKCSERVGTLRSILTKFKKWIRLDEVQNLGVALITKDNMSVTPRELIQPFIVKLPLKLSNPPIMGVPTATMFGERYYLVSDSQLILLTVNQTTVLKHLSPKESLHPLELSQQPGIYIHPSDIELIVTELETIFTRLHLPWMIAPEDDGFLAVRIDLK